jgi:Ca-activated chloride channel homolog
MTFTALTSAWLFALLVPLVIFYFLKLKRPRQIIPSLVLWRQVLNDQRVNSPFQRFKRNLLLLLQILLLTLLVLAAMQPFLRRSPTKAARLPVLLDVSASMAATADGKSRLAVAKERLRERIAGLGPDEELCLIAFSKAARRLTGFTNNQTELRDALATLEVDDVPGDLDEALRLAQALARTSPFDRVLVLTDGNLPAKTNFELPFSLDLQKLPPPAANAGITACNARRSGDGDWELFIQLAATDPAPGASATVTLTSGGTELAKEQVALVAGGAPRLAFRISGAQSSVVRATLSTASPDSLASDNDAWLTLPATRALDVFVPENLAAFRHALGSQEGVRIFPAKDVPSPGGYDLAIVDRMDAPPARVTCTMGVVPDALKPLVTLQQKSVGAIDWRRESPLLQHVSLDEVIFMDDPTLAIGKDETALANAGFETLATGPRGPLIIAHHEDAGSRLHLLFHPDRSTLPFRVAFPIFVSNLTAHAQKLAGLAEASAAPTGVLPPQTFSAGAEVKVSGPANLSRTEKADPRGLMSGIPAPRVGEYTLSSGGAESRIGASLLSLAETSLASVNEVEFGDRISVAADTAAPKSDRALWWMLACVGFAVLLLEWWWFQRRPF